MIIFCSGDWEMRQDKQDAHSDMATSCLSPCALLTLHLNPPQELKKKGRLKKCSQKITQRGSLPRKKAIKKVGGPLEKQDPNWSLY